VVSARVSYHINELFELQRRFAIRELSDVLVSEASFVGLTLSGGVIPRLPI
jgi:hypothetical protein